MKQTFCKVLVIPVFSLLMLFLGACAKDDTNSLVLVEGGTFVNKNSSYYDNDITVPDFYISKYEITQEEWMEVMGENPSQYKGDRLPVETITWYDSIEYCNKRSELEGLEPYYNIDKSTLDPLNQSEFDTIKWNVTINENANGYRLPTTMEWEYAASGGQKSKGYTYSGGNKVDDVAWYFRNSGEEYISGEWQWNTISANGNKTNAVGEKKANELGLYDMSGNVREWCFDWYEGEDVLSNSNRVWRGGGWIGDSRSCDITYIGKFEASGMGADQGFRVCRNKAE